MARAPGPRPLALVVVLLAPAALAQGRFRPVAPLSTPRVNHTATLLPSGRVLVCGGRGVDTLAALASCERFEPKRGRWLPTAPMARARAHHAAVALADGRVLVTGGASHHATEGQHRFVALPDAELYDERRDRWTPVGAMAEARNGHSATRLDDGSVLVVGGARELRVHLASVERFDPVTGAFRAEAPLLVPRWLHAALRTPAGEVLVVGGRSNAAEGGRGPGTASAAVERFSPVTGAWTALPELSEPRQRAAVVALGDAGVAAIGGQTGATATNYAERWAEGLATWQPFDNHLPLALSAHTGTVLPSGDVLVVGGETPAAVDTRTAQRWSAREGRWCLAGELLVGRKQHTAALLPDGRVLVVGGTAGGVAEASAEVWRDAPGPCLEPPGLAASGPLDLPGSN